MTNKYFFSCDWGTSNFRLRLVTIPDLKIVAEESSDKGISDTYKAWQAKGEKDDKNRRAFYAAIIKEAVLKIESGASAALDTIPVVLSGMASSTIGMVDIPYKPLPFPLDGSGLKTQSFSATHDFNHELILISGIRSDDDVMRGEETQLVGSITEEMKSNKGRQLFIHPGTHSKHIIIENGKAIAFKTYMSGEFFKLLTTHGILRDNVEKGPEGKGSTSHFEQGVRDSINANLLHAAFKVRTNDLFRKMTRQENYEYLSGLLIGTELQELKDVGGRIYLGCGATLINQYKNALEALGYTEKVTVLPAQWIDESVIRGQYQVLNRQSK